MIFRDIVCGVDGSFTAREAVNQAVALATPGGRLHFVCVAWTVGEADATAMSNINPDRAQDALAQAVAVAAESGIEATAEIVRSSAIDQVLLEQPEQYDLLVVGSLGHSRAAGIALGSSATSAAHRAAGPVLIARRLPDQAAPFPKKILVASDGSQTSDLAVATAAEMARQHGSQVLLVRIEERTTEARRQLSEQAVQLAEVTGREPTLIEESGQAPQAISRIAEREQVSLLVVGSRGLGGAKALGSVSERVAHQAPCSVLIVRPPRADSPN